MFIVKIVYQKDLKGSDQNTESGSLNLLKRSKSFIHKGRYTFTSVNAGPGLLLSPYN